MTYRDIEIAIIFDVVVETELNTLARLQSQFGLIESSTDDKDQDVKNLQDLFENNIMVKLGDMLIKQKLGNIHGGILQILE